jgi:hypothetical protein
MVCSCRGDDILRQMTRGLNVLEEKPELVVRGVVPEAVLSLHRLHLGVTLAVLYLELAE